MQFSKILKPKKLLSAVIESFKSNPLKELVLPPAYNEANLRGHIHGPNCDHSHDEHSHQHGSNCNHSHEEDSGHREQNSHSGRHFHGQSCNHSHEEQNNHSGHHVHGPNCSHDLQEHSSAEIKSRSSQISEATKEAKLKVSLNQLLANHVPTVSRSFS